MNQSNPLTLMVCIASAQSAANILPVVARRPERVVIIQSEKMARQANELKYWLNRYADYQPEQLEIHDGLPDSGISQLAEYALDLRGALEESWPEYRLILNATGGNKLMALAFVDVFRDDNIEIIYTDTDHDILEVIEPKDQPAEPIPAVFNIPSYLASQGYLARKTDSDDEQWCANALRRKALTKWLVEHIDSLIKNDGSGFLPQINGIIHRDVLDQNQQLRSPKDYQQLRYVISRDHQVLRRLTDEGIIAWTADDAQKIQFPSAEAAQYLGGRWLEEYAWHIARDTGAEHIAAGMDITDAQQRKDGVRNELDMVMVHNNRLLLVECKTGQIQKEQRDSEVIYKLDSLANHAGGLYCERLLVSAAPVDHQRKNGQKVKVSARARSYDIDVLQYQGVKKLREVLLNWMNAGRLTIPD
ncbi:Card1-like endonuclease domain-containing protein [Endozoicomonas acroporae]|uniref:Card1-like endonuclease domain-containing protein n=1 Tax=Endozoicomonas acroporae TaxID=1701104 RepID=UPI003D7A8B62